MFVSQLCFMCIWACWRCSFKRSLFGWQADFWGSCHLESCWSLLGKEENMAYGPLTLGRLSSRGGMVSFHLHLTGQRNHGTMANFEEMKWGEDWTVLMDTVIPVRVFCFMWWTLLPLSLHKSCCLIHFSHELVNTMIFILHTQLTEGKDSGDSGTSWIELVVESNFVYFPRTKSLSHCTVLLHNLFEAHTTGKRNLPLLKLLCATWGRALTSRE